MEDSNQRIGDDRRTREFISLTLPGVQHSKNTLQDQRETSNYFNSIKLNLQRRSLSRRWRSFSRLQRSMFLAFILMFIMLTITLLPLRGSQISFSLNKVKSSHFKSHFVTSAEKPDNVEIQVFKPENNKLEDNFSDLQKHDDSLKKQPLVKDAKESDNVNERQKEVVEAFLHAWKGYKTYAWGHDHLRPLTKTYHDWFGVGLTIIDSLDTMYIMGLKDEFKEGLDFVRKIDFNRNVDVNLFESTIRVVGGLLGAYHLSKEAILLDKAKDFADRLLPCFNSRSGVPYSDVNLKTHRAHSPQWTSDSSVSEITTVQLEFRDLSHVTGNQIYAETVNHVSRLVHKLPKSDGLVPIFINVDSGQFRKSATITLGARGDSYYEYLLKQWLQNGMTEDWLRDDYVTAIEGVIKNLMRKSKPNNLVFIGELLSGKSYSPKMDHLVCFLPGTLALGYKNGLPKSHLKLAEALMYTCYQMYAQQKTFLSPEIAYFNFQSTGNDIIVKSNDAHNIQRPETVESLLYMYRITGDKKYQEWGWEIFQAFIKYMKVKGGGFHSIGDVREPLHTRPRDMMESFFLGETLKYFYLLFSDDHDLISLDRYVFNTEAHPFPIHEHSSN